MKSAIPAKFQKNGLFWDDHIFKGENIEKFEDLDCSGFVRVFVCFTSCPCGNQVDGSPHVVHQGSVTIGTLSKKNDWFFQKIEADTRVYVYFAKSTY